MEIKTVYLSDENYEMINSRPGKNFQKRLNTILTEVTERRDLLVEYRDGELKMLKSSPICEYRWNEQTQKALRLDTVIKKGGEPTKKFISSLVQKLQQNGNLVQVVDRMDEGIGVEVWSWKPKVVCKKELLKKIKDLEEFVEREVQDED